MQSTTNNTVKIAFPFQLNPSAFIVSLSDAEAQVIKKKAKKAGVSINEYMRNAALGFPMG